MNAYAFEKPDIFLPIKNRMGISDLTSIESVQLNFLVLKESN